MAKSIVIVESPAKARTIEKYLGKNYLVRASAGHIKDLPKNKLGVDVDHDFQPTYRVISGKEKVVKDLRKAAAKADAIYLAADPDREGEAICQHLAEELNDSKDRPIHRILFNEITKSAIREAIEHPSVINADKVAAQQARRILDRLVGYKVSPLLWQKVRRGLSAGRVQSVALRLVVDREREIQEFVSEEYWNFSAEVEGSQLPSFTAKAIKLDGKKFKISNEEEADQLLQALRQGTFSVESVTKKQKKRRPVPPFVTSKLQQEASRKLRFTVKKTMSVAQRLYEGIEVGAEGRVGLITYMRTDSTRVSNQALAEARDLIGEKYGAAYLPEKAQVYRSKKGAQDAHEAIRPTSAFRTPAEMKSFLGRDEFRLYELIWKRFVASQMNPALFDATEIDIQAPRSVFRATGEIPKFDGFLRVYQEGQDDVEPTGARQEADARLPELTEGEILKVHKILPEQKFTQPPPRYTEATLVKALEERGIGRPSTYAQILTVIQNREYVEKQEGRFVPSETGSVVAELLVDSFAELFDYDYTAKMERALDNIESGGEDWIEALTAFYSNFSRDLEHAERAMKNLKKEEVPAGEDCEKCGSPMVIKWGRFGRFMACANYPECKNTKEIKKATQSASETTDSPAIEADPCEKCGKPMALKKGRYGEFFACTGYPDCRNTRRIVQVGGKTEVKKDKVLEEKCPQCSEPLMLKHGRYGEFVACSNYPQCRYIKQEGTGVQCPECGKGELVQRKSRRGKVFYSCNTYPKCETVVWNKPVPQPCPKCDASFLLEKTTKRDGTVRLCPNNECDFKEPVEVPATT